VTRRTAALVGLTAVAHFAIGCSPFGSERAVVSGEELTATVRCEGSTAELEFDPAGRIEARVGNAIVAWADAEGRSVDYDVCDEAPTQGGWSAGIQYMWVRKPTSLTCRFPGHFSIHVHPTYRSDPLPDGSAIYLVLDQRLKPPPGPNRTILASASVERDSSSSSLAFSRRHCTAR
jgi:hypothetical protein